MTEIAHTTVGRNGIFLGLISHFAAILVALISASGTTQFFNIVFPVSCLFFMIAIYTELKHRDFHPFKQWRFYVMAAATIVPLMGPLLVLAFIYSFQESKRGIWKDVFGFIRAVFRLKVNLLIGFALIVILLFLLILTTGRNEKYYKNNKVLERSPVLVGQKENRLKDSAWMYTFDENNKKQEA